MLLLLIVGNCKVLCRGVGQLHKLLTKISENLLVFPKLKFGGIYKNAHKENRDFENKMFFYRIKSSQKIKTSQ
jgi:hypothetical protein